MRHLRLLMAVALAAALGCQSGQVGKTQFSDDGNVTAFHDSVYRTVYLADGRGVEAIDRGEFVLSKDGRWLLVIQTRTSAEHGGEPAYFAGDRMTFIDVAGRKRYTATLGRSICRHAVQGKTVPGYSAVTDDDAADGYRGVERMKVFFLDGPEAAIGPFDQPWDPKDDRAFVRWRPAQGKCSVGPGGPRPNGAFGYLPDPAVYPPNRDAKEGWVSMRRSDTFAAMTRPAQEREQAGIEQRGEVFARRQDWLLTLSPDGWNAKRTVWVRPDGSVVEVLRQSDLPLKAPAAFLELPIDILYPPAAHWGPGRWSCFMHNLKPQSYLATPKDVEQMVKARRESAASRPAAE